MLIDKKIIKLFRWNLTYEEIGNRIGVDKNIVQERAKILGLRRKRTYARFAHLSRSEDERLIIHKKDCMKVGPSDIDKYIGHVKDIKTINKIINLWKSINPEKNFCKIITEETKIPLPLILAVAKEHNLYY